MNRAEFGIILFFPIAAILSPIKRNPWLLRAALAAFVYIAVLTITSTDPVRLIDGASVRYLAPLIPLCIAVPALCLRAFNMSTPAAATLAACLFFTNLGQLPRLNDEKFRFTILNFLEELKSPPTDPHTVAADWINQNVKLGESISVCRDWRAYPFMFHAPQAIYAWQLAPLPDWATAIAQNKKLARAFEQFKNLPAIHFKKSVLPEYVIAFGPVSTQIVKKMIPNLSDEYRLAQTIDCYWDDLYRPELYWHRFTPVTKYNKQTEAIYVFQKLKTDVHAPSAEK